MHDVTNIVDELELEPHPEGGFYRETYRSVLTLPPTALPDHDGPRSAGSSILYLLPYGEISAWHRVASDELWLYQAGDPMELKMRPDEDTADAKHVVGMAGDLQVLVPAGWWQSASPSQGEYGYSLVACVVIPGFDFDDFELA
jgi:hypothetical protein